MKLMINWTFDHDDHAPFGNDEHVDRTEFYSFLITLIFFLIGFFGNIFMLIINIYIRRHSYQGEKRTLENFLLEISAFDLLVLFYHLINEIIRYRSNVDEKNETMIGFINISAVSCKLLTYLIRISTLMSHWLILLLLLNRIFLVHSKFHRFITIINAKYAVLGLLFLFTLFNVPPIESISYNEPLPLRTNFSSNLTLSGHCLMNAEMVDIHASIYSTAVLINVFFYTFIGLILPTILIFILSIIVIRKGSSIWKELHQHENPNERISLRHDSPILEYLRTYNVTFGLAIVFVFFSIPSKIFRLILLFASNDIEDFSSTELLLRAHSHSQTIGHAFELAIYSYKCFVCLGTHRRFQSALKYLFNYRHHHRLIVDRRTSTKTTGSVRSRRAPTTQSEDGLPLDVICKQLKINEFDSPIQMYRGKTVELGLYSQRSSFKTRSSVSSRRTKEDEISL